MKSSEKTGDSSLFGMYPPDGGYIPKRSCGKIAISQLNLYSSFYLIAKKWIYSTTKFTA
jgi:hypothetical protein